MRAIKITYNSQLVFLGDKSGGAFEVGALLLCNYFVIFLLCQQNLFLINTEVQSLRVDDNRLKIETDACNDSHVRPIGLLPIVACYAV